MMLGGAIIADVAGYLSQTTFSWGGVSPAGASSIVGVGSYGVSVVCSGSG